MILFGPGISGLWAISSVVNSLFDLLVAHDCNSMPRINPIYAAGSGSDARDCGTSACP